MDYFLGDEREERAGGEVAPREFPLPLRIQSWNWAQGVFCEHTPRQKTTTLTIGDGERVALLPPDFYDVFGVYDSHREMWCREIQIREGDLRYADEDMPSYWIWSGKMYLEQAVSYSSGQLELHYWATWPEVEYDDGEYMQEGVYTPEWAEPALCYLTAAFCFQPLATQASDLNQYKNRIVDAGDPLDNPRAQQARENLWWYENLLAKRAPARNV